MVCATSNLEKAIGTDTQYSIHALTDEAGSITEGYIYDAYGRQTVFTSAGTDTTWFTNDDTIAVSANSAVGNPYGYTGRRFDNETENCYFRNRYYNPDTGRFVNRDPAGYVNGWNLYGPLFAINRVDPSGLLTIDIPADGNVGWEWADVEEMYSSNPANPPMGEGDVLWGITRKVMAKVECECLPCYESDVKCKSERETTKKTGKYWISCTLEWDVKIYINEKYREKYEAGEANIVNEIRGTYGHEKKHVDSNLHHLWKEGGLISQLSDLEKRTFCKYSLKDCEGLAKGYAAVYQFRLLRELSEDAEHEHGGHADTAPRQGENVPIDNMPQPRN